MHPELRGSAPSQKTELERRISRTAYRVCSFTLVWFLSTTLLVIVLGWIIIAAFGFDNIVEGLKDFWILHLTILPQLLLLILLKRWRRNNI